jgi:hypothetical protein
MTMDAIATAGLMWTYKGQNIYAASLNGSGTRWYAIGSPGAPGVLKAGTKADMREAITYYLAHPAS